MLPIRRMISNKSWMKRHVDDPFVKKAKAEDLRSRSAFKLLEIHEKHKIFCRKDVVVDLGNTIVIVFKSLSSYL